MIKMKHNRYALVTGAADRIGKSIVLHLAKMGFHMVLHYRSSLQAAMLLKEVIEAMGRKAILLQFDFLKDNDYDQLFDELREKGIELEVLVNSASEYVPSGFQDRGNAMLTREIKSNFEGAYLLTKSFARIFGTGTVINLLDTKISKDYTMHLDYMLAKKLLAEFTRMAAIHLAPDIRINGICPGIILPPKGKDNRYLLNLAEETPLKRIGKLEDIQKAVQFLIECDFITGQILFIDGGEHLAY